jgi:multiple sugar transport system permease protein
MAATMVQPAAGRRARRRATIRRRNLRTGFLFASPWLIGFFGFEAYPLLASFYYSLTQFNVFQRPLWLGTDNYQALAADPLFWTSLGNTLYMAAIGVPIGIALAFAVAMLLNGSLHGLAVFRTLVYIPTVTPIVASSLLWLWILNPVYGPVNSLWVGLFHVDGPGWFATAAWAKPGLIVMNLWGIGTAMVVFLAALQGVPEPLYEAARIDGANAWQRTLHVTLPLISPATLFLLVVDVIHTLQIFASAYVIGTRGGGALSNGGGPENSLLFYALYLYESAFNFLKMGYASAMAWILFLVILVLVFLIFRSGHRWVHYES